MTTTHNGTLQTQDPMKVTLPTLDHISSPEVHAAAEHYFDLHDKFGAQVTAVSRAERALYDAQTADETALAAALEEGKPATNPRARAKKAQSALDDATVIRDAYRKAVIIAYGRLVEAVTDHGPAWAVQVRAEHQDALDRYGEHLAGLRAAGTDLLATGALLSMLGSPGAVTNSGYRPEVHLSIASSAAAEALSVVTAHLAAQHTPELAETVSAS